MSPDANLTEESNNRTYKEGTTATLVCTSSGGPNNTYQWQENGEILNGQNSNILTLPNVTASTGGIYTCIVSNIAGSNNASTYVFIFPYFINHPHSGEVSVGSAVLLICDAASFPSPDYLWQRADGVNISNDIVTNERNLSISSIEYGDEGVYFCTVSSREDSVPSDIAVLTGIRLHLQTSTINLCFLTSLFLPLVAPESNFTAQSINRTYYEGDNATLVCTSSGGPNNTYQWLENGEFLHGQNSTTLLLPNVTASTGGFYTCMVSNIAGSNNASTFVFIFPYFISHPRSDEVSVGSAVLLICDAASFPSPDYLWQRSDGVNIRNDIMVNQRNLNISSVEYGDQGGYYCTVSAREDSLPSNIAIVTGNHYWGSLSEPQCYHVMRGGKYCRIDGRPITDRLTSQARAMTSTRTRGSTGL